MGNTSGFTFLKSTAPHHHHESQSAVCCLLLELRRYLSSYLTLPSTTLLPTVPRSTTPSPPRTASPRLTESARTLRCLSRRLSWWTTAGLLKFKSVVWSLLRRRLMMLRMLWRPRLTLSSVRSSSPLPRGSSLETLLRDEGAGVLLQGTQGCRGDCHSQEVHGEAHS